MAAPRVLVGTSGFSYPSWRGTFYPEKLAPAKMLAFYAEHFASVEINNTFYRMPTPTLLSGWRSQVPNAFRFALKAPQRITHQLRLKDADEATARFCELAATLGDQQGPLLFQLPPHLRADLPRLETFLATLPEGTEPAFEFRHETWLTDETYAVLAKHRAALCIADAEGLTTPVVPTAPFGYLRLRREDYTPAELDTWAGHIAGAKGWKRTYVYFKHDDAGRAAALAKGLLERLG